MDPIPYFERVKIQSEILLPLYRRLRAEIGNERAAALLREAVQEYGRGMGKALADASSGSPIEKLRGLWPVLEAQDALKVEKLADNDNEFSVNIRGCRYAEYFREIGEPEFGAMLTCEVDPPLTEGIGDGLRMERTQTIAKGASHCDFRWKTGD